MILLLKFTTLKKYKYLKKHDWIMLVEIINHYIHTSEMNIHKPSANQNKSWDPTQEKDF